MPEATDEVVDAMTFEEAVDNVHYWAERLEAERDRAFDDLLGWVAGQAIHGDPSAAGTLRRIRDRAEHR